MWSFKAAVEKVTRWNAAAVDNVEEGIQEAKTGLTNAEVAVALRAFLQEHVHTVATSGAAQALPDVTTATMHRITLTANCTITLPVPGAGKSFALALTQDSTGSRTVTFTTPSGTIRWERAEPPTLSTAAGAEDLLSFACIDGTHWLGLPGGFSFA